jgi:hydrogenase-4 component E
MATLAEITLVFVLLTNLALLSTRRPSWCIWQVAAEGAVLGLLPLLVGTEGPTMRLLLVAAITLALKGVMFPKLLFRSLRTANVRHESMPIVGYTASMVLGIVIVVVSFSLTEHFPLPEGFQAVSDLVMPVALSTLLCGLLMIVIRRQALMQVVGYLVLENGIFVFGVGLAHEEPLLIEMGILLDVFVAVFVMGIAMFHISRTFDHIDVGQLSELRD